LLGAARADFQPVLPRVHDEFSYLLAADTFAHGRLTNPPPPLRAPFETIHVLVEPSYASKYPPGQPLALACGQAVFGHAIWGVWLSLALATSATTWALQAWLPARWALVGGLLLALHPTIHDPGEQGWSQSYWGSTMALLGGALLFGALEQLRRDHWRWAGVLGLGVVLLALTRPFEGLLVCGPAAFVFVRRERRWPAWALVSAIVALGALGLAYSNQAVTGHWSRLPYVEYDRQYGYAPLFLWGTPRLDQRHPTPAIDGHQMGEWAYFAVQQTPVGYAQMLAVKAGLWWAHFGQYAAIPLLALPAVWHYRRVRLTLAVAGALLVGALLATWSFPRYQAPAFVLWFYISALGLRWWSRTPTFSPLVRRLAVGITLALFALRLLGPLNDRIAPDQQWVLAQARITAELRSQPGPHLVFVEYGPTHDFNAEWVYNRADLATAPIVWARATAADAQVRQHFPGRTVWRVQADVVPVTCQRVGVR
jgi:hypothetical protein